MRELTMNEVEGVAGGGDLSDIADSIAVGGAIGGFVGYVALGPPGAMAGAVYGGLAGFAFGGGFAVGTLLYRWYNSV